MHSTGHTVLQPPSLKHKLVFTSASNPPRIEHYLAIYLSFATFSLRYSTSWQDIQRADLIIEIIGMLPNVGNQDWSIFISNGESWLGVE
jgi:hypothetical protein